MALFCFPFKWLQRWSFWAPLDKVLKPQVPGGRDLGCCLRRVGGLRFPWWKNVVEWRRAREAPAWGLCPASVFSHTLEDSLVRRPMKCAGALAVRSSHKCSWWLPGFWSKWALMDTRKDPKSCALRSRKDNLLQWQRGTFHYCIYDEALHFNLRIKTQSRPKRWCIWLLNPSSFSSG